MGGLYCRAPTKAQIMPGKLTKLFVLVAVAVLVGASTPASASPKGYIEEDVGVGFFYGTFNQEPNIALLVGGTAEEFCEDNPGDPFNAEPGTASRRVFVRTDGTVDYKVNDNGQPIHLYYVPNNDDLPDWIVRECAEIEDGGDAPVPFASGTAKLKIRDQYLFEGPPTHILNSVNGKAFGPDGTKYHVRASADIPFVDGMPVGSPPEWVSFSLR